MNTDLAVIPGGLTSVLQPLDICLNKPFKEKMRQKWNEWITSGAGKTTNAGNLSKPDLNVVVSWVREAWDEIPCDIAKKSFLKCGITNQMDGSEDDCLYEGFEDVAMEYEDEGDYTADIAIIDETCNTWFNNASESELSDDSMQDEAFQILSEEEED